MRLIQKANLGLLKIFDRICKENGISYWLDFGTLLGAVRHKGFIPWDDDIDVGIMRDNYEKIITIFEKGLEDYPDLYCSFSHNGKNKCFVKIRHKKSENIFVDLFPYDSYYKKLNFEEQVILSNKITELMKKKFWMLPLSEKELRKRFKDLTHRIILESKEIMNENNPALFWGLDFPHKWSHKVYSHENIFPLGKILFEDSYFPCPNMTHYILTNVYHDYMSLPKDTYPRHSNYMVLEEEERKVLEELANIN